jgi:predicted DNA-binding transcriptional regulator AlpA
VAVVTVDKWRRSGYLPAPVMLGDAPVWNKDELVEWMQTQREVRK